MRDRNKRERFEEAILPHLGAAYNLAQWLTRNPQDAEDVVQEAYLRAFRFFDGFHGGDGRGWLLTIVRNTFYTWLGRNRPNEVQQLDDRAEQLESRQPSPEEETVRLSDTQRLERALDELPAEYREVVILRELEGMSYKEISEIVDIPLGTVMSRLARARKRLTRSLTDVCAETK
ncbi:MAG TPA: sigma-70 family RNA polymerase sigma factor [Blastocatellia bacterium]|nr:sigma-70 family RNA polymerase sigma factor [Blastocatellia bacterium]